MGLKMRCIITLMTVLCAVINAFQIIGALYNEFRWNFVFFSSALILIHPNTCKTFVKDAPKWINSVQFSIMYTCFATFN